MLPTHTSVHEVEGAPKYGYHQCLCPQAEPQPLPASLGDSPRAAGRSGPGSYQITAFALCPMHVKFCARPLRVKSLFPPVLWDSRSPAVFQSQMLS